jgi:hypothetical protein
LPLIPEKTQILNKKHIIIGGIIFLILSFFAFNNYKMIEKQNSKYKSVREKQNFEDETNLKKESEKLEIERYSNRSVFKGNKVFVYSSQFYDIEKNRGMITKNELTYHTFNFEKKTVTQNSIMNGKRINIVYPFKKMYEEKGILATTYVLEVNTNGLKEIWWSPDVPNLGYDYDDGTRIACYGLKIKTK